MMEEKATKKIEEAKSESSLYPKLEDEHCTAGIPYPTLPATARPHTRVCFYKHPGKNNHVVQKHFINFRSTCPNRC